MKERRERARKKGKLRDEEGDGKELWTRRGVGRRGERGMEVREKRRLIGGRN